MAKKTQRQLITLQCTVCKHLNYTTEKNKTNTTEKVNLKKFCPFDRKVTAHVEKK